MHGGFGDAELLCGGAYRSAVFDHVHSQCAGSLLDGVCHSIPPMLCADKKAYEPMGGDMSLDSGLVR